MESEGGTTSALQAEKNRRPRDTKYGAIEPLFRQSFVAKTFRLSMGQWRRDEFGRVVSVMRSGKCRQARPSTLISPGALLSRKCIFRRPNMKKRDFIICAPLHAVNNSHGILALVQLGLSIEKSGHSVYFCVNTMLNNQEVVVTVDFDTCVPQNDAEKKLVESIKRVRAQFGIKLLADFSAQRIDECYVVYPEIMLHNPLKAKRVVRYFLNKDGNLRNGERVNVGETDFILAHSKVMYPKVHHVCFFAILNPLFNDRDTHLAEHRKLDITYIGKGEHYGLSGTIPGTIAITRTWPETKEQLAILLRNCRFFYTGDACSAINAEALRCGAIPAFLDNGPWSDEEIDGAETGVFPRLFGGMKPSNNFFAEFEIDRGAYLERLQRLADGWDASVVEMVEKVNVHFESRLPSPLFAEPAPISALG